MAPLALCLPFNAIRNLLSGKYGMALITPVLAVAFVFGMVWDDIENSYAASISSDANSDVVVLSFANAGTSAAGNSELILLVDFNVGLMLNNHLFSPIVVQYSLFRLLHPLPYLTNRISNLQCYYPDN